MPTVNDLYQRALFEHAVGVESTEDEFVGAFVALLASTEGDLTRQISEELEKINLSGTRRSRAKLDRLTKMLDKIRGVRRDAWTLVVDQLRSQMNTLVSDEVEFARVAFERAVSLEGIKLAAPSAQALRAATFAAPFQFNSQRAQTLTNWLASLREADLNRIEGAIRLGFVQSEETSSIIRRIRGTRANRFRDGILQVTRRQGEVIVRTAVNHFANTARAATWEANDDIILGLVWTAVLDGRTTNVCVARDGRVSPLGSNQVPKGMGRLEPPSARPPAHAQCRSIMVALISPEGLVGTRPFVRDTRTSRKREIDFRRMARQQGRSVAEVRREWAENRVGRVPSSVTAEEFFRDEMSRVTS